MRVQSLRAVIRAALCSVASHTEVAESLGCARNTVKRYRLRAAELGMSWTELDPLDDVALERKFNKTQRTWNDKRHPDWEDVQAQIELGKPATLVWEEYRAASPDDALAYSQFASLLRNYLRKRKLSMRQYYAPGERAFIDFSGKRPFVIDRATGEATPRELFVGVLGNSAYTFAIATPSQQLPDFIHANRLMLEAFGGVPLIIVPDNLKAAVVVAGPRGRINDTYLEMAEHYGFVVLPTRSRRPRDKARVENAVGIVQRWILARLRGRVFFSDHELNQAIRELVADMNTRAFKRRPGSRVSNFEDRERQALKPMPAEPYEYADWIAPRLVGPDYHLRVGMHDYSIPYTLRGERLATRITPTAVEFLHNGSRVAVHARAATPGCTTVKEHQPDAHRAYAEHTPENLVAWAQGVGPSVTAVMEFQFTRHRHPALGLPAAQQLRALVRTHGVARVEAAAKRAIEIHSLNVKSVRSLLSSPAIAAIADNERAMPVHENVRGSDYYADKENT